MIKALKYSVIGIIVCILVGSIIYYYFMDFNNKSITPEKANNDKHNNNKLSSGPSEGTIELLCELPTNTPALPDLVLPSEVITSEAEAFEFGIQYFPEFEKSELIYTESTDPGGVIIIYMFRIGTDDSNYEFLEVSSSGALIYSRESTGDSISETLFTENDALTIANNFISNHGGFDDFVLDLIDTWGMLDEYGDNTGIIRAYFIDYIHSYDVEHLGLDPPLPNNEVPICNGDGIRMTVTTNEVVNHFFRLHREPYDEVNPANVISASYAYNSLLSAYEGYGDMDITNVDICYYSENYEIVQSTMQPAWRFEYYVDNNPEKGDNFVYVNARNGEVI